MANAQQDGGPAFPGEVDEVFVDTTGKQPPFKLQARQRGMSLRDYFAAKAMAALPAVHVKPASEKEAAEWCYRMADALLAARKEQP